MWNWGLFSRLADARFSLRILYLAFPGCANCRTRVLHFSGGAGPQAAKFGSRRPMHKV